MPESLLAYSLVLIVAAAGAAVLARLLGLPPSVGFLAAGLAVGPHGFGLLAPSEGTTFLSELGVVLLMFLTGLEFSLAEMMAARATVFGAGGLQVALTTSLTAIVARLFGFSWPASVVLGGVVAMSSTALSLKQLAEQSELGTTHGRLAVGMLVFQDLAALPFLVVAGTAQTGNVVVVLIRQIVIAGTGLVAIAFAARPVFGASLAWVAATRSGELFLIFSLALALGAAFVAEEVGLPLSIGAFLAGMVVAESDFRHQIEEDIRPFRDVLLGLFFVSIGMQIDPAVVASAPFAVVVWTLVFTVGKGTLIGLVARILGWAPHVAVRTGVVLAHGGEFGLLLLTQALNAAILDASQAQPMLVALLLTMALAPVLIQRSGRIAQVVAIARTPSDALDGGEQAVQDRSRALTGHVILCGCGRVGRPVAVVLEVAGIPYIAIESDLDRFRRAKAAGHNVVFADASHSRILDRSGVERASAVVVTFKERQSVERVLRHARHRNAQAPLIVSAADDADLPALVEAGATVVFPEHLAAGLALAGQLLRLGGHSEEQTAHILTRARAQLTPALGGHVGI
jgi:CPA2 family monovalent cation:H+ antiporter-2